jgi:hypothetical protein
MSRFHRRSPGTVGALAVALAIWPSAGLAATAPYAPAPTTHPTALKPFDDTLSLAWKWGPKSTKLLSAKLAVAGPDVTLVALYLRPKKHGGTTLVSELAADGRSEIITALAALERRSFATGDKLQLTFTIPGELAERVTVTFRDNKIPTTKVSHPQPLLTAP